MTASSLSVLLSQFQARYPIGSLSADLLTIHQEQYVVRAIVQMGGTTLATAMAAASALEAAEDRAKLRVLESLIVPQQPAVLPAALPATFSNPSDRSLEPELVSAAPTAPTQPPAAYRLDYLSAVPTPAMSTTFDTAADDLPATAMPVSLPAPFPAAISAITSADGTNAMEIPTAASQPTWEAEFQSVSHLTSTVGSTVGSTIVSTTHSTAEAIDAAIEIGSVKSSAVTSGLRTSKTERANKRSAETSTVLATASATEPATPEPADRSEEIMRIGIEMKRLGWSTEQGREYLKRTYGKSSRSKLDDAELLDFLHYLEIQS